MANKYHSEEPRNIENGSIGMDFVGKFVNALLSLGHGLVDVGEKMRSIS